MLRHVVPVVSVLASAALIAGLAVGSHPESGVPVAPGIASGFKGVSCATATWCVAVGSYETGAGGTHALVERWDGSGWVREPAPSPGSESSLRSVACPTISWCLVAGSTGDAADPAGRQALLETWDGTAWSIDVLPRLARPSSLEAVACGSVAACHATGWATEDGVARPFDYSWGGGRSRLTWIPFPTGGGSDGGFPESIACSSPGACVTVGLLSTNDGGDGTATLADVLDEGRWSPAEPQSPEVLSGDMSALEAVACRAPAACFAVGAYARGNVFNTEKHALLESWDGGAWAQLAVPAADESRESELTAIACPGARACVAAGWTAGPAGDQHGFVEVWDGRTWAAGRSGGSAGSLQAVACPSPRLCLLAGESRPRDGLGRAAAEWWTAGA